MSELNLPYPKKMDVAVPGNRACGQCPPELVARMEALCDPSLQGVPPDGGGGGS